MSQRWHRRISGILPLRKLRGQASLGRVREVQIESPWPRFVVRLHKSFIVCMLVWIVASPEARAQILQGGQPATQMGTPKGAKARNQGDSRSPGATPKASVQLCFRPGIGWQRVPPTEPGSAGKSGKDSSNDIEANSSAAGGESKSVYAKPASGKTTTSNDCPEISIDTITLTAGVGDITTGNHGQPMTSARLPGMSAGTLPSLQGTSLFNPAGGAASGRRAMTLGSMPSGSTHRSSGSEPGISSNPVNDLKSHAYISSIVLRRMIRTAPDLETRIKLQELQDKLSNKSHISSVSSKGNQGVRGRSKGAHVGKADSLVHGRWPRPCGRRHHNTFLASLSLDHTDQTVTAGSLPHFRFSAGILIRIAYGWGAKDLRPDHALSPAGKPVLRKPRRHRAPNLQPQISGCE